MDHNRKLALSLLLLRLGVFAVIMMWTLDKFINPGHAAGVYESFYAIGGPGAGSMAAIAALELLVLALFLAGVAKIFSYGAVLVFHAISTLPSHAQYLAPFDGPNLLFFAAWPMLAACVALFLLRAHDTLFPLQRRSAAQPDPASFTRGCQSAFSTARHAPILWPPSIARCPVCCSALSRLS